ncbi:unnamed protein product [Mucor hiemalis]
MADIKALIDEDNPNHEDLVILDKCSVMGLFIRKCVIEYASLPFSQLLDIQGAFDLYIHHTSGDTEFLSSTNKKPDLWISDYNVQEFLDHQAEKIERTGTCDIEPTILHRYLAKIEAQVPNLYNTRKVRYLNHTRTKEYTQALSQLHLFFDMNLTKGIAIQHSLLNLGILEYKFGHSFNALSALNDALSAARSNHDKNCLQEVQYWIETCRNNHPFNSNSSYTDNYLANMKTLTDAQNMVRNGGQTRYVFESLYKSAIRIIMSNIKGMHRAQFLTTSLAWRRYGNSVMAKSYLYLAENIGDDAIDDVEKTYMTHATYLEELGDSKNALKLISKFTANYPNESDLLLGWRQVRARILRQTNKKRKLSLVDHQEETLDLAIPPYSEEYFEVIHNNALRLLQNKEFEKALLILDETNDFIRKTDYTAQLGYNLILQADTHLQMHSLTTAIPLLNEAMQLSRRSYDTKNYYTAIIKLSEAYNRMHDPSLLEKSLYMLEAIFPKVLLLKSKLLHSDLYLAYAEALDTASKSEQELCEYLQKAEEGYRELGLKHQLLRTLHFETMVYEKMKLPHLRDEALRQIRNLQNKVV